MPGGYNTRYWNQMRKRASARGKRMANRRWELDKERRNRLAAITAEQYPAEIIRRIIVIDNEITAREAIIRSWDSFRSARRKLNWVLAK